VKKSGEPLGPLPAELPPELPATRATVLAALAPDGVALAEVVRRTRLHANTVREHLDALVAGGQVERRRAAPVGRGRPAWLYAAADQQEVGSPYAVLASTLASALATTSATPREDAARAGTAWGRDLVRGRPGGEPRARVAEVLGRLGFAPQADEGGRVLHLTRCPLLDAARAHPDVVCAVHLGLVRGALAELGTEEAAELFPFSEPGACRLELG
jgi:predicted ArsR family transcriptional regulator